MSISSKVVIMTHDELLAYRNEWFQKGVERGRFEERCDQSRAKATEGKAGTAVVTGHVRRSTTGSGLRVGVASAGLPATSEIMDVTAGETAPNSDPTPPDREAVARIKHGDCDLRTVLMAWFEPEYPSPEETNQAYAMADKTIDAILALTSGGR